jgi:hypothetical protein
MKSITEFYSNVLGILQRFADNEIDTEDATLLLKKLNEEYSAGIDIKAMLDAAAETLHNKNDFDYSGSHCF